MPLDLEALSLKERVAVLNEEFSDATPQEVLKGALQSPGVGLTAMVSSFGAESVVLLHMLSQIDRLVPVLFLDTEMLFPETLAYQKELSDKLKLNTRVIQPDRTALFERDQDALLHRKDPDACCALRKTEPLEKALTNFDAWITGRKRAQGGKRAMLPFFEVDADRLKVNPLAQMDLNSVQSYIRRHGLPSHPLVARGYPSIGCAPCTTKARPDEDPRAGRWRGQEKSECGIHIENGRVIRRSEAI